MMVVYAGHDCFLRILMKTKGQLTGFFGLTPPSDQKKVKVRRGRQTLNAG